MRSETSKDKQDQQGTILNIVGQRVSLGPLRKDLPPLYQRWINDLPSALQVGVHTPSTLEQREAWYETTVSERIPFTIYTKSSLVPIGIATLLNLDHRNRRAEFGIFIGEKDARGKGYGTETTRLMLDYAFTAVGLHNVMLRVFEYNEAAIRAYEKAGFKELGRRRESYFMGGRMWDDIYMDCLSNEFESPVLRRVFSE